MMMSCGKLPVTSTPSLLAEIEAYQASLHEQNDHSEVRVRLPDLQPQYVSCGSVLATEDKDLLLYSLQVARARDHEQAETVFNSMLTWMQTSESVPDTVFRVLAELKIFGSFKKATNLVDMILSSHEIVAYMEKDTLGFELEAITLLTNLIEVMNEQQLSRVLAIIIRCSAAVFFPI